MSVSILERCKLLIRWPFAYFDQTRPPTAKNIREFIVGLAQGLLLVMCTHPFAKEALTFHLACSEGYERLSWL